MQSILKKLIITITGIKNNKNKKTNGFTVSFFMLIFFNIFLEYALIDL